MVHLKHRYCYCLTGVSYSVDILTILVVIWPENGGRGSCLLAPDTWLWTTMALSWFRLHFSIFSFSLLFSFQMKDYPSILCSNFKSLSLNLKNFNLQYSWKWDRCSYILPAPKSRVGYHAASHLVIGYFKAKQLSCLFLDYWSMSSLNWICILFLSAVFSFCILFPFVFLAMESNYIFACLILGFIRVSEDRETIWIMPGIHPLAVVGAIAPDLLV